ncbi:MAG: single-stranded DNA-binding protein [Actinomycetota bacterium]
MGGSRMPVEAGANEVVLEGRLAGVERKALPSGDEAVTFRVVVARAPRDRGPSGRVSVDAIDCVAWRAEIGRRVERWGDGIEVRVEGALRRRFWQAGNGPASRVEIEARRVTALH